ncbi:hypothetical protein ATCC90586_000846 [Pythium insidiosum]|nr:hypothetical protein ATCC90586_000846 [Pythium insidiosum]
MASTSSSSAAVTEFEMAVLCAFQYASASLADQQAQAMKAQAESFCDRVKASPSGWRACLELFELSAHAQVKFYALQALQELLVKGVADDAITAELHTALLAWMRDNVAYIEREAPYLKTKLAVVITLLIKRDYPDRWPTAFTELMALLPLGASMVEMYFRILVAINEEIVEFDANRTPAEAQANMRIKDAMRESSCMADTFDAIYGVLVNCDVSAVMCQLSYSALQTLQRYISWVDISLIVNDRFIPLLFKVLHESAALRCPAANCIFEIIDKGMNPDKKLALIAHLNLLEVLPSLPIQDDDEFAEEIAEIVNGIGLELIECMDAFRMEGKPELFTQASTMLCQLMPLVWDLFAHDTKDVSEEVFEIVNSVGTLIRADGAVVDPNELFQPSAYIPQILHGIYRQTRYPEDSDSDEAEFEEYRRSLYKIYVNITRKRPLETLTFLTNLVQELPPQFAQIDPRDLESFLSLVFRYKEGLAALKTKNAMEEPTSPLTGMVIRIHSNMIAAVTAPGANILHPSVLLAYYDLAHRYSRVLQNQSQLIPAVLDMMFGASGLTNPHANVRSRVCYLCLQLVKSIGSSVHPHVANILQALLPRLAVPEEDADGVHQKQRQDPTYIPYDDQVYLFELSGQVIASLVVAPETMELKYQYTKMILEPLVQALNMTLTAFANGARPLELAGNHCAKLLNAVANVLKAFKGVNCMANQQELFTTVLTAAACVLRVMPSHPSVRSKVVFSLHRFITILDSEHLLNNVSETLEHLMMGCESGDVLEVVQLLDQLIIRYKDALSPFFDQFLMPFVQRLCSLMPPRNSSAEQQTKDAAQLEREAIQKYLYTFLLHIAMHNLSGVLLSTRNVGSLENVLLVVLEGCADVADANINRSCFSIAHELVARWLVLPATPNAVIPNGVGVLSDSDKPRFTQLMVERFVPAMFLVAKKYHFEVHDAQCAAVMKDIATLHEQLLKALGDMFLQFLRDVCLPGVGVPGDVAAMYASQVATGDHKTILTVYKQLVSRLK